MGNLVRHQHAPNATFFRENLNPSLNQKPGKEMAGIVDLGGTGDCGFRAVAAGIIDNVYKNQHNSHALFSRLMKEYGSKYPLPSLNPGLYTPQERSMQILKSMRSGYEMSQFIIRLAYILRQLAVNEMVDYPEKYRGAFVGDHESTSPLEMRKPDTWIDESAIAALANALDLPIQVKVTEFGKELFKRDGYGPNKANAKTEPVVIQLQSKHYRAEVSNTALFNGMNGQLINTQSVLSPQEPVADPDMPEIFAKIAKADKALIDDFEKNVRRLKTMFDCKEITKETLLDIYIAGMADSDYLRGRIRYVGMENGNQSFFEEAINQKSVGQPVVISKQYEAQLVNELVHAIARAVSIGQLDESTMFEQKASLNMTPSP